MELSRKTLLCFGMSVSLALIGASVFALKDKEVSKRNIALADSSSPYTLTLSSSNGAISGSDYSEEVLSNSDAKTSSGASFSMSYYHAKGYSDNYCILDAHNPKTNSSGKDGYLYSANGVNGLDSMTVTFSNATSVPGMVLIYFSDTSTFSGEPMVIESGRAISVSGSYFKIQALSQPVIISSIDLYYSCDEGSHSYSSSAYAARQWKEGADIDVTSPTNSLVSDFAFGVDMSMVAETESLGGVYKNENGNAEDPFMILFDDGFNYARLRLWVDPYSNAGIAYGAGTNDLDTTIHLAKRAKAAGMKVLLDLHYSDFWTHPNQQNKPKSWDSATASLVSTYTTNVMNSFKDEGITLDAVQVGNEINTGMAGVSSGTTLYYDLIEAGINSVNGVFPSAKIMLHVTNIQTGAAESCIANLAANLDSSSFAKVDAIGVSYYPYWHGSLDALKSALNKIASYDKEAMVLETSWAFTYGFTDYANNDFDEADCTKATTYTGNTYEVSAQGQTDVLCDILDVISQVDNSKGTGLFYWGGDYIPVSGSSWATDAGSYYASKGTDDGGTCTGEIQKQVWANQALFDYEGNVLGSAQTFRHLSSHGDLGSVTVNVTRDEVLTSYPLNYQNDGEGYWTITLDLEQWDKIYFTLSNSSEINGWYISSIDGYLFADGTGHALVNYDGTYTLNVKDGTSEANLLTYTTGDSWDSDGILDSIYFSFTHKMNNDSIALYVIDSSWTPNWLYYNSTTDEWSREIYLEAGEDVSLSSNGANLRGWYLNKGYSTYFANTNGSAIVQTTGYYTFTVKDGSSESCLNYYTSTAPWASDDDILSLITITYSETETPAD